MKKIIEKWNSINLVIRILCGIILGAALGLIARLASIEEGMSFIGILGTLFVGALKALAPILVFILIISSIATAKNGLDRKFGTVIALYIGTTLSASILAVCASFIFKVKVTLIGMGGLDQVAPGGIGEVLKNLLNNLVQNPLSAIIGANYLGILFWAILFGIALRASSDKTKEVIGDLSSAVSACIRWVISLAPFGILGLVFTTVCENGLEIFVDYGALLALIVGCMLLASLVINPIIASVMIGRNAYPLVFRCLRESGLTAFFTRSSAANIPVNMRLCEKLGLDKNMYSVSIPLGATINRCGHHHCHHGFVGGILHGCTGALLPGDPSFHSCNACRLRCIGRCGRISASHSHGVLASWRGSGRGNADGWYRLYHRRRAGFS